MPFQIKFKPKPQEPIQKQNFNPLQWIFKAPIINSWPKQTQIAFLLLIILALPVYLTAKKISFTVYSKMYYSSIPLAKKSFSEPENPRILQSGILNYPDKSTAFAEISNPNLDLYLPSLNYKFIFLNKNEEIIKTETGKTFLLPGQKKFLSGTTTISNPPPAKITLELNSNNLEWQKRLFLPKIKLKASTAKLFITQSPPALNVTGNLQNLSPYIIKETKVTVMVSDLTGTIIALSQTGIYDLRPNEMREYQIIWPNISPNMPNVKTQVFTDTDLGIQSNLTLPETQKNPASDLSRPTNSDY